MTTRAKRAAGFTFAIEPGSNHFLAMNAATPKTEKSTTFQKASFLIYLLGVSAAFLFMLRNFLMPLFLAAVFTGLSYPIYTWLLAKVKKKVFAALITLISLLLVLVLPLIAVIAVAYQEAVGLFSSFDLNNWRGRLEGLLQSLRVHFPGLLDKLNVQNVSNMAFSGLQNSAQFILKHSADISLSLADNVLTFFLMLFIMFYFYIDGPHILNRLIKWSPLKDEYERILIEKFVSVSKGTLKGFLAIGVIQGIIGALLFWAVGLHSPIFLGVLMVFGSLVPAVGTAIVWGPVALTFLAQGHWGIAIIVVAVGGVVISSVDNVVRPKVVGKDIKMHDLLVLLSTIGGIGMFGLAGFIIGPVLASLFLSIWNIYEEIFADDLAQNSETGFQTGKIAKLLREPPAGSKRGKSK
jgi:predicted PurR-regulated permease PerM